MERIIVGVDGSDSSADALRWAQREAQIHGARLTALLAWNFLDQHHIAPDVDFDPHYDDDDARRALAVAVEHALGPDGDLEREVVCDHPATALLEASEGADLLMVGARGLGSFRGLVLGSVSQRCLEGAACPVMVVHGAPGDGAERRRVLVGVDGSEHSATALAWAAEEARQRGAALELVHAWDVPYAAEFTLVGDAYFAARRSAVAVVEAMLGDAGLTSDDVVCTVVQGPPVTTLTDAAVDADLVVVGSRGRGGFAGLLLGSVSHQVARHAGCPVVVVPEAGGSATG